MFTRITGREVRSTPMQISAPIMTPTRGRPRFPSATDVSLNSSIISLSKASAPARKKVNRRSLSADNLWEENAQRQESDPNRGSDGSISTGRSWIRPSPVEHVRVNSQTEQQEQGHGLCEVDLEFYKSSIEFLKTHHSRSNTADDWARRNKRKTSIPRRRQSESSLLEETLEANDNNEDTGCGDNVTDPEKQDDSNPFGPGSCWKDLDSLSADHSLDEEFRSLLSSVDIMLVPCISSPTRYYDCPKSRKVVRTYLTSGKSEFDEMIEFGFPASAVIEDKEGKVKDCRFMTLRLTLTPWHARADESKLYGTGDSEKSIPLKDMVNKFISRTSARISCSPPARVLSLVPDARPLSLKSSKSSASDNFLTQAKTQIVMPSQSIHPLDEPPVASHTQTELHDTLSIQRGDCQPVSSSPPKNLVKSKADIVHREKGFRIMDPSSNPPLAPRVIRSVRSVEFPSKDAESYTSPPTTPSPTSLPSNQHQPNSYGNQQQSPRKGSLPAVPMPKNTNYAANTTVSEENMRIPPTIPPRRKFSSPSIFNEQQGLPEPLPSSESLSRSKSATPFVASSKTFPTQPQPPQQTNIQPRWALTSSQPPSRSSPSSSPNANAALPTPISGASGCQQQDQKNDQQYNNVSSTDADIHGAPVTRTSRAPSRKRSDQTDNNVSARAMPTPTPRQGFDVNTMTTTTTTQEYIQVVRHPHHAFKDTHIPRSQYMPPVSSH
ncbi:hypothetical protein BGZ80_010157 [Entomortierella chlamydospora]|uniref:Uncharacterized protein n=1 Tax=Entomortierella chlamydospora TaxID=101097 RepID=A0A9P6SZY3_9FUNG|nr:hypothetical protein BGZ80_010157 [Entomortierella chlamydospora]